MSAAYDRRTAFWRRRVGRRARSLVDWLAESALNTLLPPACAFCGRPGHLFCHVIRIDLQAEILSLAFQFPASLSMADLRQEPGIELTDRLEIGGGDVNGGIGDAKREVPHRPEIGIIELGA